MDDLNEYTGTPAEFLAELVAGDDDPTDPAPAIPVTGPQLDTAEVEARLAAAAAAEEAALVAAVDTLNRATSVFRAGQQAHGVAMLATGGLIHQYILQCVALGNSRASAVEKVVIQLSPWSTDTMSASTVNHMVATWAAYEVLGTAAGLHEGKPAVTTGKGKARVTTPAVAAGRDLVPYSTYRNAWTKVVTKVGTGTTGEHWVLLPGFEEVILAAYKGAVAGGLNRVDSEAAAGAIYRDYAAVLAEADRAETARLAAEQEATAKAQRQALAEQSATAKLKREADERARLAALGTPEEQAAAEQEVARLAAEQKVKDDAKVRADHAEEQKSREVAEAKTREKKSTGTAASAQSTVDRQNGRANGTSTNGTSTRGKGTDKPATVAVPATGTPLLTAAPATPGDVVSVVLECQRLLERCKSPDEAVVLLLRTIGYSKVLSSSTREMVLAACGLTSVEAEAEKAEATVDAAVEAAEEAEDQAVGEAARLDGLVAESALAFVGTMPICQGQHPLLVAALARSLVESRMDREEFASYSTLAEWTDLAELVGEDCYPNAEDGSPVYYATSPDMDCQKAAQLWRDLAGKLTPATEQDGDEMVAQYRPATVEQAVAA